MSQKNLELMLDSQIKNESKIKKLSKRFSGEDLPSKLRYSVSLVHNLSELIHGDTECKKENTFLPIRIGRKMEQPTADITLK